MGSNQIYWKIIIRYLKDECNPKEYARIRKWMNSDREHQEFMNQLEEIWELPAEERQHWDSKQAWLRYKAQYGFDDESEGNAAPPVLKKASAQDHHQRKFANRDARKYRYAAVAALVIFVVLAVFGYHNFVPGNGGKEDYVKKYATRFGQKASLHLKDGSKVRLNAGSKLKVPDSFSDSLREVWLSGEAYFNIKHGTNRPFIVHTVKGITKVLGTRFDVQAYPSNSQLDVIVVEGMVSLRAINAAKSEEKFIVKDKKGTLGQNKEVVLSRVPDVDRFIGWTEGKLVFTNDSLPKVIAKLNRWYGIGIKAQAKGLTQKRLTATFKRNQRLYQVLDAIALTLNISYSRNDSTIVFNRKVNTKNNSYD